MTENRQSTKTVTDTIGGCFFCSFSCLSFVFSWFFIGFGISLVLSGVSSSLQGIKILDCNRINPSKIDCQIKKETLTGTENIQTIQDLKRAEIVTRSYKKGLSENYTYIYEIILVSQNPTSYVIDYTTSISPDKTVYADLTGQINDFIKNPNEKVLKIETNNGSFGLIILGIFLTIIGCTPWLILTIAYRFYVNRIDRQR